MKHTKIIMAAAITVALGAGIIGCQKEPAIHSDPAEVHEEHHNILVGHTWQMEQDTFISGFHFIVKAKLTFLTDSTGEYWGGDEIVNVSPWYEETDSTTYFFDENNNTGVIQRLPAEIHHNPIIFEYFPDRDIILADDNNTPFVRIE